MRRVVCVLLKLHTRTTKLINLYASVRSCNVNVARSIWCNTLSLSKNTLIVSYPNFPVIFCLFFNAFDLPAKAEHSQRPRCHSAAIGCCECISICVVRVVGAVPPAFYESNMHMPNNPLERCYLHSLRCSVCLSIRWLAHSCCTLVCLPGSLAHFNPVKGGCSASGQRS